MRVLVWFIVFPTVLCVHHYSLVCTAYRCVACTVAVLSFHWNVLHTLRTRRRKKLQNVEARYSGMDVKRSISQDTSNSFCMGSKNELVARSVERSPPAANVVVCSGGPPIPEREPRGELVVSLSPSPAVTANGHSIGQ